MAKSYAAALLYDAVLNGFKIYRCQDKHDANSVCTLLRMYISKHGYKEVFKVARRGMRVVLVFRPGYARITMQGDSHHHVAI